MANNKESKDNARAAEISRAIAKRQKRFASGQPGGPTCPGRRKPLSEALDTKLSEVADEASGRTFSEMIADKLVADALAGKLPALVLSKMVLATDPKHGKQSLVEMFADKSNEELIDFLEHGRWPEEE